MTDAELDKLEARLKKSKDGQAYRSVRHRLHTYQVREDDIAAALHLIASARRDAEEIERLTARLAKWEPSTLNGPAVSTFEPLMRCNKQLAALGKAYPRMCLVCRLGPCRDEIVPHAAPAAHTGEG